MYDANMAVTQGSHSLSFERTPTARSVLQASDSVLVPAGTWVADLCGGQ
jgi:hypothetical protein